jgi:hypothetical protein
VIASGCLARIPSEERRRCNRKFTGFAAAGAPYRPEHPQNVPLRWPYARHSAGASLDLAMKEAGAGERMIFFSVGIPGRFSHWCDSIIAGLAGSDVVLERYPEPSDMIGYAPLGSPLDEAALTLIRTDLTHLVMGVRQPDERLRAALAETNAPFIVTLDHPRRAAAELLADTKAEPRAVTRAIANSCGSVVRFPQLPGALLLHADQVRDDKPGAVAAIARHLGFAVDNAAIENLPLSGGWEGGLTIEGEAAIPPSAEKMMGGAFAGYDECFAGRGLGQLVWNRDLFIVNDPDKGPMEVLDVSGGARILIYGPYIRLAPGPWVAQVYLGFSGDAAGQTFLIDVFAAGQLAATSLRPTRGGALTAELHFFLTEWIDQGVEIRVTVPHDDAKGRLAFGHVVLTPANRRHPDAGTEWEEEVRAVLGC